MTRREFLVWSAALPVVADRVATAGDADDVLAFLAEAVRDGTVPGAALIASRDCRVRLERCFGTCCELGHRRARLTPITRHPLYSLSKLITATVVGMVKQEGRLDYDTPVARLIPEFKGAGKEKITLRHCLTHSAGLPNVPPKPARTAAEWDIALQTLCAAETEWAPGSKTQYHAWSGAFLAAECARRVSGGKPWAELCREKLFVPLGAQSLSFDLPKDTEPVAVVPQPDPAKPLPKTLKDVFSFAGHPGAGCFGTLADALKVFHLHLREGVWDTQPLLAREVFREIHTVQFEEEISAARAAGRSPAHEPWGLGPLLRGNGPACDSQNWFGFHEQNSPGVFGHAGIDTLIGVGDRNSGVALVFATTHSPKPPEKTMPLRNGVTNRVFAALGR
jgi:CubicO group peptidase (beta-lactamase class C family)